MPKANPRVWAVTGCCSSWLGLWAQLCSAICTAHISDIKSFREKLGVSIVCRRDKGSKVKEVSHKQQEKLLLLINVLAKLILNDQSSTGFNVQLLYMAAELKEACGMGVQLMLRLTCWNPVAFFQIYGCFPNVLCSVSHWKCLQNPVRIKTCCKLLPLQLSLIKFQMELHFSTKLTKRTHKFTGKNASFVELGAVLFSLMLLGH